MGTKLRRATNAYDLVASLTSPTYAVVCITDRLVRANHCRKANQKGNQS